MTDTCFMCPKPKIVCVYVYPLDGHGGFSMKALEFAQSYERNPPGMAHETLVVCNGAPANQSSKDLFNALPNTSFIDHDNSGWDIGGFQLAARSVACDLMVFFGSHTYFRRPGWLARMWEAFEQYGDTLYGASGNQGNLGAGVYPHIRTTAFWCSPKLLADYPMIVTEQATGGGQRYLAEHGPQCITSWVLARGCQPHVVGWDRILPLWQCDAMPNRFRDGDQSNLLVGDKLTMPPFYPTA